MPDLERDSRRLFSARERVALYLAADGTCSSCGTELPKDFHADHERPHSRGGLTDVLNGQALCPDCNCRKGARPTDPATPVDPAGHHVTASAVTRDDGIHPAATTDPAEADVGAADHPEEILQMKSLPQDHTTHANGLTAWPDDPPLRAWQRRAVPAVLAHDRQAYLMEACPAAGKTRTALRVAHERLRSGEIDRVVIVCPTASLARQWAREAAQVGIRIEPNWSSPALPRDCHGVAITYQRLAACPELYRHACRLRTLVLADEPHHMGDTAAWGKAFMLAFEPAVSWLLLSGTPFRSDNQPIPGVRYDDDGVAQPDFVYDYRQAVRDGICRKIAFVPFDGELKWSDGGTVIEATFGDDLDAKQSAHRHRTALSPGMSDGLGRMITEADQQLTEVRAQGHQDAGGLIIACDILHARNIAAVVRQVTGQDVMVIASDEPDATRLIDRFRDSNDRWVIAVNMVSEGVDIPRLRVGVYATVAKTPLLFRQIVGRFVRVRRGLGNQPSYLFLPADPALRALAAEIEQEIRHELAETVDPVPVERELGISEHLSAFIPLDARVEAQATLMSGLRFRSPAQAAAIDTLARDLAVEPEEIYRRVVGDAEPVLPALPDETEFERRERLRRERKRLVGHLHHRSGREYSEIQTWINDAVAGGRPVTGHTLDELERTVRTLTREIAGLATTGDATRAA